MQRLIDANELWGQIYILSYKHRWKDKTNIAFSKCLDAIQFFPTVDAEPVVRCKDCKFFDHSDFGKGEEYWCTHFVSTDDTTHCHKVIEDDFCAWGERRNDETD